MSGPRPEDTSNEKWPLDRHGLRTIETGIVDVGELGQKLKNAPADAIAFIAGGDRQGSKDQLLDGAWNIAADHPPGWPLPPPEQRDYRHLGGRDIVDTVIVLSANTVLLEAASVPAVRNAVQAVLDIVTNESDLYYAFVNIEDADDTTAGTLYTPDVIESVDPDLRKEEIAWWHHKTDRDNQARGVYWGNVLGQRVFQRMRSANLLDQVREAVHLGDRLPPGDVVQLPGDFVLIRLSGDPLDSAPTSTRRLALRSRRDRVGSIMAEHGLLPTY